MPPGAAATDDVDAESDSISLASLTLPAGILAPTHWGPDTTSAKQQPGTVSVVLRLRAPGFRTAASSDALDGGTVHYGVLAKQIRARCERPRAPTVFEVIYAVERAVVEDLKAARAVERMWIEVGMEKGSMFGDGVVVGVWRRMGDGGEVEDEKGRWGLRNLHTAVLVGVNDYERSGRQVVVSEVECGLARERARAEPQVVGLGRLEALLVKILADTAFETLESLAEFTVDQLRSRLLDGLIPGGWIRLKLTKPRAVAFADAPGVEVFRRITSR